MLFRRRFPLKDQDVKVFPYAAFFLWCVISTLFTLCVLIFIFFDHLEKNLPPVKSLRNYRPPTVTTMYGIDGSIIGEFYHERRYVVPLEGIPLHVRKAFLAAEDARFYEHPGVDIWSIVRAAMVNVRAGAIVQGGSTITQQVVKALLLSPERTLERKIREAVLAYKIDRFLSKDEIFNIYLNHVYFGAGAYGVEAAARTYFEKHVQDLSIAEAAMLAGLPKAPSRFNPFENLESAKRRQRYVLKRMAEEHFISEQDAEKALQEPLVLKNREEQYSYPLNYFVEEVRKYLVEKLGEKTFYEEGLQVYTSLDPDTQKIAEEALKEGLSTYDRRHGYRGPIATGLSFDEYVSRFTDNSIEWKSGEVTKAYVVDVDTKNLMFQLSIGKTATARLPKEGWKWTGKSFQSLRASLPKGSVIEVRLLNSIGEHEWTVKLEQNPEVEGAFICVDPHSGEVFCMVGGKNFLESQFNRVTQMKRQPGSAFKPIVYAAAIDHGFTEASIVEDTPFVRPGAGQDDLWKPGNFDGKFMGPIILRDAVAYSRNVVAVKVLASVGIRHVIELSRKLGITSDLTPTLSLALGASGLSLWELSQAYATFANGGEKVDFHYITRIVNRDGNTIFERMTQTERVLSPETAYIITDMLKSVVQSGTGRYASRLGYPAAGKTGTTNDFRDAWFIAYTPDLLAAVWVGYDDFNRSLGRNETGGRVSCPIWTSFMQRWYDLKKIPPRDFPVPPDVVFAKIDLEKGTLAGPQSSKVAFLPFKKGNLPPPYESAVASTDSDNKLGDREPVSIYKTGLF